VRTGNERSGWLKSWRVVRNLQAQNAARLTSAGIKELYEPPYLARAIIEIGTVAMIVASSQRTAVVSTSSLIYRQPVPKGQQSGTVKLNSSAIAGIRRLRIGYCMKEDTT